MRLLDRLLHLSEPGIPVHEFFALLGEYSDGFLTKAQAGAKLEEYPFLITSPSDKTDLLNYMTLVVDPMTQTAKFLELDRLHRVVMLGQAGVYDRAEVKARIQWPEL